jgi:hypothetical protein
MSEVVEVLHGEPRGALVVEDQEAAVPGNPPVQQQPRGSVRVQPLQRRARGSAGQQQTIDPALVEEPEVLVASVAPGPGRPGDQCPAAFPGGV